MTRSKKVETPLSKTIRYSLKPTALIPEVPDDMVLKGTEKLTASGRLTPFGAACRRELFRRTSETAQDYQHQVLGDLLIAPKISRDKMLWYVNRGEFHAHKNPWEKYINTWRAQLVTTSMPHKLLALGFAAQYFCAKHTMQASEKQKSLIQLEALSLNLDSLFEVSLGLIRIFQNDLNSQNQLVDKLLALLTKNDTTVQGYAIAALKRILPFVEQKKETYLKIGDLLTADIMLDENVLDEIIVCLKFMWENKWINEKLSFLSDQAALLTATDDAYRVYRAKRIITAVWPVLSLEDEKPIRIAVSMVLKGNHSPEIIEVLALFYISTQEEIKKESLRKRIKGFLQHENPAFRYAAIKAMKTICSQIYSDEGQAFLERLVLLTQDSDTYVSIEAIKLLKAIIPNVKQEKDVKSIFNAIYEKLLSSDELSEQEIIVAYNELSHAIRAIWKKLNTEQQTKIITLSSKNVMNLPDVVVTHHMGILELLWSDLSDDLKGKAFKFLINIFEQGSEQSQIVVTEIFIRLWSKFITQKNLVFGSYEKILAKKAHSDLVKNAVMISLVALWTEFNDRISIKICDWLLSHLKGSSNVLREGALKGLIALWPDLSEDTQAEVFTFINRESANYSQYLEKIAALTAQNWIGITAEQTEMIFELIWNLHAVKDDTIHNAVLEALMIMFDKLESKQQAQIIQFVVASLKHPASDIQEKAAVLLMLACPTLDKEKTQVEAAQMERQIFEILTNEKCQIHAEDLGMALATLISQSDSAEQYMRELAGKSSTNFIFVEKVSSVNAKIKMSLGAN